MSSGQAPPEDPRKRRPRSPNIREGGGGRVAFLRLRLILGLARHLLPWEEREEMRCRHRPVVVVDRLNSGGQQTCMSKARGMKGREGREEKEEKRMSCLCRWSLPLIRCSRKSQDGSLWARLAQEEPQHRPPAPKGDKRPQGCMLALISGPAIHQLPRRETGRRRGEGPAVGWL
jgi:hypothetical protein